MRTVRSAENLPELGVGVTYSTALEPLLQHPGLVQVIEIEPQSLWLRRPGAGGEFEDRADVLDHLLQLPAAKLIHSIGVPVGGSRLPEPAQIPLLAKWARTLRSPWFSEHLSFNSTEEFSTGFFLAPRQTEEGIRATVRAIETLQSGVGLPMAVETGVNYLRPRRDEIPDGAFVAQVAEAANCGILLDLHNVFTNQFNGRQSADDFMSQIPLERVWEVHLAGGSEMDGFWLDAHCGAMPDALVDIAEQFIPRLPNLKAINFEVFPSFIPLVGLDLIRKELERLHHLWDLRGRDSGRLPAPRPTTSKPAAAAPDRVPPSTWENALGALVAGQAPPAHAFSGELASDPGVKLMRGLVNEFRGSMLVSTMRLSVRLLFLSLGQEGLQVVLNDFWSKVPPQMYAALEAEAFAQYLQALDLKVPKLAKVVEFERAVLATAQDDQQRVVAFDFDPLPLMRALAEGRLPEIVGAPGSFEIAVTPDASFVGSYTEWTSLGTTARSH